MAFYGPLASHPSVADFLRNETRKRQVHPSLSALIQRHWDTVRSAKPTFWFLWEGNVQYKVKNIPQHVNMTSLHLHHYNQWIYHALPPTITSSRFSLPLFPVDLVFFYVQSFHLHRRMSSKSNLPVCWSGIWKTTHICKERRCNLPRSVCLV